MLFHSLWFTCKCYLPLALCSIKNNSNFAEKEGWTNFKLLQLSLHILLYWYNFSITVKFFHQNRWYDTFPIFGPIILAVWSLDRYVSSPWDFWNPKIERCRKLQCKYFLLLFVSFCSLRFLPNGTMTFIAVEEKWEQ